MDGTQIAVIAEGVRSKAKGKDLPQIFREETQKLQGQKLWATLLRVAERLTTDVFTLAGAIALIYRAFDMTPTSAPTELPKFLARVDPFDRFFLGDLEKAEKLLGLESRTLYALSGRKG